MKSVALNRYEIMPKTVKEDHLESDDSDDENMNFELPKQDAEEAEKKIESNDKAMKELRAKCKDGPFSEFSEIQKTISKNLEYFSMGK